MPAPVVPGNPGIAAEAASQPPAATQRQEMGFFPLDVHALVERCAENEIIETPAGGIVIRGLLDESEQRSLYEHIWDMCVGTKTHEDLQDVTRDSGQTGMAVEDPETMHRIPMPVAYWTHPYSRACSVQRAPEKLLKWAERLMHTILPETGDLKVDSMLAQTYFAHGGLGPHLDRDLSWGLGLSLGAAARFCCWHCGNPMPVEITLHSGDLIIGEFGKMLHSVEVLGEDTAPAWWSEVPRLGRARCNVLFRQALSEERQRELSEPRAKVLHGKSLDAVIEELGQPLGECALSLRHEMDKYAGEASR